METVMARADCLDRVWVRLAVLLVIFPLYPLLVLAP